MVPNKFSQLLFSFFYLFLFTHYLKSQNEDHQAQKKGISNIYFTRQRMLIIALGPPCPSRNCRRKRVVGMRRRNHTRNHPNRRNIARKRETGQSLQYPTGSSSRASIPASQHQQRILCVSGLRREFGRQQWHGSGPRILDNHDFASAVQHAMLQGDQWEGAEEESKSRLQGRIPRDL